ncbi:DgyrCDS5948 [Dimorphilus gyrociliatus]|uniref:Transporter n=1 Tax=Dimorphilus gyrociliatus TaxID=2664684 RepID=A0A7I8VLG8_9ANNE|nr:DgyrCDS5948 [Dimorphilus gyrociliatus]
MDGNSKDEEVFISEPPQKTVQLKDEEKLQMLKKKKKERRRTKSTSSYVEEGDENRERGNWSGKLDFILSCLSFAVGLGNVWRFPYQCYKNGGGAFLFPFVFMLGLTGIPMFFLESSFGQYAQCGVITIWNCCPLFRGIGIGMMLVSFFVAIYYNVIISWTFYYFFSSFTSKLPWAECGNVWNTENCRVRTASDPGHTNCTSFNGTWYNSICYTRDSPEYENITALAKYSLNDTSPSDEYFHRHVLHISSSIDNLGGIRWPIAGYLLLSWVLVGICLIKGIKSSGRAVYFTSTFPYVVLTILLIKALTLPGASDGLLYFITPKWEKLLQPTIWADAAVQIFFSLAPGWGGLICLSSYNKFKNNCLRDAFIVSIGDILTSVFAGLVIFSIIGYMANDLNVDIDKVANEGPGLAFIVYPEVVTKLPVAPLWSMMFFLMLITLGLGTQFAILNTVHTTLMDLFPNKFRSGLRPTLLLIILCIVLFLLGLPCCTEGGMYVLTLLDNYSASYSVLIIALTECLVLAWVYGYDRFKKDIYQMLEKKIGVYWFVMWKFITPIALVVISLFTFIQFKRSRYDNYEFPVWAEVIGWMISFTSVASIPAAAIFLLSTKDKDKTFLQRVRNLTKPTDDWGEDIPTVSPVRKRHKSSEQKETKF